MIHIRIDYEAENSKRRFACGIGPELPEGDKYVGASEFALHHIVNCPICIPGSDTKRIGTPLSELSGRSGYKGYEEFTRIARSWGYE